MNRFDYENIRFYIKSVYGFLPESIDLWRLKLNDRPLTTMSFCNILLKVLQPVISIIANIWMFTVFQEVLSWFIQIIYLIFLTSPCRRYDCYPHFAEEETDLQINLIDCSWSQKLKVVELRYVLGSLVPEPNVF